MLRPLWTTMSSYSSWGQRRPGRGAQVAATWPAAPFLPPALRLGLALKPTFPPIRSSTSLLSSPSTIFKGICVFSTPAGAGAQLLLQFYSP